MSTTPPDDPTLRDTQATTGEVQREDVAWKPPERYELSDVLGRGGMGEVMLAYDRQIGRGVAIKRMRGRDPSETAATRFLREAKVQARLDHPAIVPVHEIGRDDNGQPYFTMKRLVGKTLHDALAAGSLTRQQALRVVIDVCLAIELAHTRAVVHRDLKPANIMMGDFGEVYVIDWGVARVSGEARAITDVPTLDEDTQSGALLGTPGYMAPEQVRGEEVGAPADVYALGAILFEVLAGQPLHPAGTAAIASTLMTPTEAPSARAPDRDIPPELDTLCVAALAEAPAARPTARHLADAIQRYLDGDRDLETRRKIAATLLADARNALARDDRAAAMQAAGRALALDPESEAAAFVSKLMLEPPPRLPPEVEARLAEHDLDVHTVAARQAVIGIGAMFALLPLLVWNGITSPRLIVGMFAFLAAIVMHAWLSQKYRRFQMPVVFGFAVVIMVMVSRLVSPLMVVPPVVTTIAAILMMQHGVNSRPVLSISALLAALLAPLALEAAGVLGSTWSVADDQVRLRSQALEIHPLTVALIVTANATFVVIAALFARGLSRTLRAAQRKLEIQAWYLGKLLPAV